jgi:hypothetical protein
MKRKAKITRIYVRIDYKSKNVVCKSGSGDGDGDGDAIDDNSND